MQTLVKDGTIILDGTAPKYEKIKTLSMNYEKIQNIENKLGMDIPTLFEALFHGAYIKTKKGRIIHLPILGISDDCLLVDSDTESFLAYEDYGKVWSVNKEVLQATQKYKDCYVKLIMTNKETEAFDSQNHLRFLGKICKEAVLHCDQMNDEDCLQKIQDQMLTDLFNEKKWGENEEPMKKVFVFRPMIIGKKSEPITYRF